MIKTVSVFLVVMLILSMPLTVLSADSTVYTEGTLYYTVSNDSITITGCFGKKTEITVPASIAGYPVNAIASGAFSENQYLEKLNLPDTITKIDEGAIKDGITIIYNCNTQYPSLVPPEILVNGTENQAGYEDPIESGNPAEQDPLPVESENQPLDPVITVIVDPDENIKEGDADIDEQDYTEGPDSERDDSSDEKQNPETDKDPDADVITFSDVPADTWYTDAVFWAVERGITNGVTEDRFSPMSICNRAQIVTFLWRAAGEPEPGGANPFDDVKPEDYFYKAVLWAVKAGITTGVSNTSFAPSSSCTRAQIVTFLWRASGKPAAGGMTGFSDVPREAYYKQAVAWAVSKRITLGTDDIHFSPNNNCNRAQAVTFLYRAFAD